MATIIQAIYERGLFRPTQKVSLTEGTAVEVVIPEIANARDPAVVAATLSRLAGSSSSTGKVESTSLDHDAILNENKPLQ